MTSPPNKPRVLVSYRLRVKEEEDRVKNGTGLRCSCCMAEEYAETKPTVPCRMG